MKSIKIFAMAAIAALALSSCSKENTGNNSAADKGLLVIKLDGVNTPGTRAVDNQGSNGEDVITLNNGWVFVFNSDGTLAHDEALAVADAMDEGETMMANNTDPFVAKGDMKVYIVGNLPLNDEGDDDGAEEAARLAALSNANSIMTASYGIADLQV